MVPIFHIYSVTNCSSHGTSHYLITSSRVPTVPVITLSPIAHYPWYQPDIATSSSVPMIQAIVTMSQIAESPWYMILLPCHQEQTTHVISFYHAIINRIPIVKVVSMFPVAQYHGTSFYHITSNR